MDVDVGVVKRILTEEVSFFTDKVNSSAVYVEYPLPNGAKCFASVDDARFHAFLDYRYCELADEDLCPSDIEDYVDAKSRHAVYLQDSPVAINRRVAGSLSKGKIVYFLADDKWNSVVVTAKGWRVTQSKKVKFLRSKFDAAQDQPVQGGNLLKLIRPFVNLDNDDFTLFVTFIVQAFSRSSSHFAAVVSSSKGTGKSTLTKLFRALVDPSSSDAALTPSSEGDLITQLAANFVACFDNTDALSAKFSDILCAAITGTKAAKRKLYSDADQVVLSLHNVVVINGIDIVPRRSDLADRSLLFELRPIGETARRTDTEIWEAFMKQRPAIVGAIFDTLSSAMDILPTLEFKKLPRMADAFKEMTAIAVALGVSQVEFQRIFGENIKKLQEAYNQSSPLVECVLEYMKSHPHVNENASSFYKKLQASIVGSTKFFPNSPSALSRKLHEERNALEAAGYSFSRDKIDGYGYIKIKRIPQSQQTKAQKNYSQRKNLLTDDDTSC